MGQKTEVSSVRGTIFTFSTTQTATIKELISEIESIVEAGKKCERNIELDVCLMSAIKAVERAKTKINNMERIGHGEP